MMGWFRKKRGKRKENKVRQKMKTLINGQESIILRIDDWILGDFDTANPFRVVKHFEMGLKSRVMRGNDLKINS
mgnify:CR=1 FL=1